MENISNTVGKKSEQERETRKINERKDWKAWTQGMRGKDTIRLLLKGQIISFISEQQHTDRKQNIFQLDKL
jgi:hypothetical protein